jgi:hypothetical protein
VKGRDGMVTLRLIGMASAVNYDLIRKVAPHQLSTTTGIDPEYVREHDQIWSTTTVCLNGRQISQERVSDPAHPRAVELFQHWLAQELLAEGSWRRRFQVESAPLIEAYWQASAQRVELNALAGSEMFPVIRSYPLMMNWLSERLQEARCLAEVPSRALDLPPLDSARVSQIQAKSMSRKGVSVHDGLDLGAPERRSLETRSIQAINLAKIAHPTVDDLKARWNRR